MDLDSLVCNEEQMATSEGRLEIKSGKAYQQKANAGKPYSGNEGVGPQGGPKGYGKPPPAGAVPPGAAGHDAEPTAPPTDSMDKLPGYNNIGFEAAALPPPSYNDAVTGPPPTRENIQSASAITDQDARDAIIQHVSEHCCYGKGPAVEMQFTGMTSSSAFHLASAGLSVVVEQAPQMVATTSLEVEVPNSASVKYTLETFGESRSTRWTSQPYTGEGVIVTGPPPGPWDLQAQAPQMFTTTSLEVEVPNSASVKPCFGCQARGHKVCTTCFGSGKTRCICCGGSGRESYFENGEQYYRSCTSCYGGLSSCFGCNGSGQVMCHKCQGRGNLRWFILLTIQWTNHLDDHIVERTALPDELIRTVQGQTAFEETCPKVWPVNHFPEQEINAASKNMVSKHASQFTAERVLMQRHRVRIVPVTEVSYSYKNKNSTFFVYGNEHKVHAPDYPAKCCWGCTVL